MLSPATFIGIAKAIAPTARPAPVRPAPAVPSTDGRAGGAAHVQPARVLATPGGPTGIPAGAAKPPAAASSNPPATPPRNLPRGSLLDLSV